LRVESSLARSKIGLLPMSFSCPHFRPDDDFCLRLKTDCVPGRRGCVLEGKAVFAVPAEERVRLKEEEKRREKINVQDSRTSR
jgi:hypothetical protein